MNRREAIRRAALYSGLAAGSPWIVAVLNGCQAEPQLGWQPRTLSEEQARLVASIVDRILPATNTPGATEVGVDRFVDVMLSDFFSEQEREEFLTGLEAFRQGDLNFTKKSTTDQEVVLNDFEQTYLAGDNEVVKPEKPSEKPFLRTLKELTLLGYFTSKPVMMEQLNYHAVPGKYEGCIPNDGRLYVDNNV